MIQDERRFCTFSIPDYFIQKSPLLVARLLEGFLILHCERSWTQNSTRYEAWHEELEPLPDGWEPPRLDFLAYADAGNAPMRLVLVHKDKELAWALDVSL